MTKRVLMPTGLDLAKLRKAYAKMTGEQRDNVHLAAEDSGRYPLHELHEQLLAESNQGKGGNPPGGALHAQVPPPIKPSVLRDKTGTKGSVEAVDEMKLKLDTPTKRWAYLERDGSVGEDMFYGYRPPVDCISGAAVERVLVTVTRIVKPERRKRK